MLNEIGHLGDRGANTFFLLPLERVHRVTEPMAEEESQHEQPPAEEQPAPQLEEEEEEQQTIGEDPEPARPMSRAGPEDAGGEVIRTHFCLSKSATSQAVIDTHGGRQERTRTCP